MRITSESPASPSAYNPLLHVSPAAFDDACSISAALRFLLVAYVGAQWASERAQNTARWQIGADALKIVLDRLARASDAASREGRSRV